MGKKLGMQNTVHVRNLFFDKMCFSERRYGNSTFHCEILFLDLIYLYSLLNKVNVTNVEIGESDNDISMHP